MLDNTGGHLVLSYDDGEMWTSPNSVAGGIAEMRTNGDFVLWSVDHSTIVWDSQTGFFASPPGPADPSCSVLNSLQLVVAGVQVVSSTTGDVCWQD
jgi:hypothetical protein